MGPGILMLLSLGGAMILSTLLVLGVQGWLVSGSTPCGCQAPPHGTLRPPIVYHNFGDVLPFAALLLGVFAGVIAVVALRWIPLLTTPRTRGAMAKHACAANIASLPRQSPITPNSAGSPWP